MTISDLLKNPRLPHRVVMLTQIDQIEPIPDLLKHPRLPRKVVLEPIEPLRGQWLHWRFVSTYDPRTDDFSWQIPDLGGDEW